MLIRLSHYSILILMLAGLSFTLSSCDVISEGELEVEVTSRSGRSVSGIELFLMDDQAELVSSAITNESGQVRWTGVQAGEYNLLASRSGVYYYDQLINIEADGIKNVEIIIP